MLSQISCANFVVDLQLHGSELSIKSLKKLDFGFSAMAYFSMYV